MSRAAPRGVTLVVTLLALSGCGGCRKNAPNGVDAGAPSGSASASGSARVVEAASPEQPWIDAREGDPLELARLSNVAGAHRLAEVADDDQAAEVDRRTALRAIAFLDDPTPALPALSHAASAGGSPSMIERSTIALQTLAQIAPRRMPIEETEPGAWRPMGEVLVTMLATTKDVARRELLLRTLLALVDRGVVERKAVPAE